MPSNTASYNSLKLRKIKLPPKNEKLLARANLVDRLTGCLDKRLTLIAAPPGSGKSELILQWHQSHPEHHLAWYNLDASDNNLEQFSRYLKIAVSQATGEQELLAGPDEDIEWLSNFFQSHSQPLVICIDNFHHLSDPDLLNALEELILDPYNTVHWVLLSQQQPEFDLTDLKLKDQLSELSSTDLNLSLDEISTLATNRGIKQNDAERYAEKLFENTQGWIAGVNLSLAMMNKGEELSSVPSSKAVELFHQLAISNLPEEVEHLIRAATICNPINAELADHINQRHDSQSAVNYLVQNCLFIQSLDKQDNWLQIHPLFFAAMKLSENHNDSETQNQHLRAGQWLIEHQIYDQGLKHLLASQQNPVFDEQLTKISELWLLNGNLSEINEWCAQVDSDRLFNNTKLLLQYLLSLTLSFHVSEAHQLLATYDRLHTSASETLNVARQLINAFTLDTNYKLQLDDDSERQQLLLKENKTALENFALGTLTNIQSLALYMRFDNQAARAMATEGKRYHRLANSIHGECYSEYLEVLIDFCSGKNHETIAKHLEQFVKTKYLHPSQPCHVLMSVAMAPLYYERNQHEKALSYCQMIVNSISVETHLEVAIYYYLTYAKLLHRNQQNEQADRLLTQLLTHSSSNYNDRAIALVSFEKMRQAMIDHKPDRGLRIYSQLNADRVTSPSKLDEVQQKDFQGWGLLQMVKLCHHMLKAEYDIAQQLLDSTLATLPNRENQYIATIFSAFQIAIDWRNKKQDKALKLLATTIDRANQQGYFCLLRDHIADLDDMMNTLGEQTPEHLDPDFSSDLLLKRSPSSPKTRPANSVTPLLEALTKRELVLLNDIANGLSNQEISNKRFVAISTVKWHLKNIYAKLDAKHRAQAIARARELQLIE